VLIDAPLPPARFGEFSAFLRRSPEQMLEALPVPMRAALGNGGRRAQKWLDALGFLVGQSSLRADLEAEPDIPDSELAQLRCETLCVYGADSACRPVGERLARVLPRARLAILPGGHYLPLEAPAALTRRIVEFVDG
jgi:pimeloyl-ACP methyl ester carboxylesterase